MIGENNGIGAGQLVRIVCFAALAIILSSCAGFEGHCQSLGLASTSSGYARCVHEQQLALGTTLFSIANGLSAR